MLTYSLRNNQDTDTVFIKQLHFLMDTVKEQTARLEEMEDTEGTKSEKEIEAMGSRIRSTIKEALVTYLAETIGKTDIFSIFADKSEFESSDKDSGEQYILSLFQLR